MVSVKIEPNASVFARLKCNQKDASAIFKLTGFWAARKIHNQPKATTRARWPAMLYVTESFKLSCAVLMIWKTKIKGKTNSPDQKTDAEHCVRNAQHDNAALVSYQKCSVSA